MTATPFTFRISDVRVEVHCALPPVMAALEAVWGRACDAALPIARSEAFHVSEAERGWNVTHRERPAGHAARIADVTAVVEAAIYERVLAWHAPPRAVLHSACIAWNGRPILFLGQSGAGKSSLTRAAVARGASYLTDDLVVTDGARLWGIPRAIQFDPIAVDEPVPEWLMGTDLGSYPLRLPGNRPGHLPIVNLAAERMNFASYPVSDALLVLPSRGATTKLDPCAHIEGLAALHAGVIGQRGTNLGGLVGPGRVWRLQWSLPSEGIDLVEAILRGASSS